MVTTAQSDTKRRARKRADGEGNIRYSETKKLWIGRLMVGYRLDGKPDIREVAAKTQKDCKAKLDALKGQAAGGMLPSADLAGLTVAAFLDRWLATVRNTRRAATYIRYRGYVELHFKPALGGKRLSKLTHDDIQIFLDTKRHEKRMRGKSAKALAPRTLHNLSVVLGTVLTWGVKKGYVTIDPMARVDRPRFVRREMVPLTAEQTTALIDAADTAGDPLVGLWTLAALTGARRGELLGLTWDDLDPDAGTLRIRPSAIRDLKTHGSRRTLDLAPDALAAFQVHRDRQAFARQALGDGYADLGLIFANEVGRPLDPDNVTKRFKRALKRATLPPTTRLHDLRHGAATMLLEAGEPVPSVAAYLGHASPVVTMSVYAHAVPGASKRAAERLGSILRNARTTSEMESVSDAVV